MDIVSLVSISIAGMSFLLTLYVLFSFLKLKTGIMHDVDVAIHNTAETLSLQLRNQLLSAIW